MEEMARPPIRRTGAADCKGYAVDRNASVSRTQESVATSLGRDRITLGDARRGNNEAHCP